MEVASAVQEVAVEALAVAARQEFRDLLEEACLQSWGLTAFRKGSLTESLRAG